MACDIRPLTLGDLPELSRFLTAGFHAQPDADFAAPDVLQWKYLEPTSAKTIAAGDQDKDGANQQSHDAQQDNDAAAGASNGSPHSYVARNESGSIIAHLGFCRTAFEGQAIVAHGGRVATIHIIDWLSSPEYRALGVTLGRKAQQEVVTQFMLGTSQIAQVIGERNGYKLRSVVPVYTRVLHAGYWLRTGGLGPVQRGLRLARDVAGRLTLRPNATPPTIVLQRVVAFGPEITPVVAKTKAHAILTSRDPARLNAFLHFPRQAMSGWHVLDETGRLRGFALLNLVPKDQGHTCTGKIVDCVLDDIEVELWHGAVVALTHELARQGADLAQAYASTPWTADALRRSGYASRFAVTFHMRDRGGLIPHDAMFHLTPLEGDYAYT